MHVWSRTRVTCTMDHKYKKEQIRAPWSQVTINVTQSNNISSSNTEDMDLAPVDGGLSNGSCNYRVTNCPNRQASSQGDHNEYSNSDLCLPEVCVSTNSSTFEENMSYEVQQAYRIFTGFLLDKHKAIASPFLQPIGNKKEAHRGIGDVSLQVQPRQKQSICLRRIEEKFVQQEYKSITEFVADFRIMLENCYRHHGVDHWISKQAQKLEIMLEQKLTLLSRTLREKTSLAVTSKGQFGAEEERVTGGTSTRRRSAPRNLATTVGGHESVMVQVLRMEEQQRAKEEKRQRELEKKEAEEMSAKEVEEWEHSLLSQASPHSVDTLWELPAIGHFLCLAQSALNLPEIVFYELERCLLMPRCSTLLAKVMSSLLSPWQRRATLHRRPTLPYSRWESELRQRVLGWYRAVGSSRDQPAKAEQLGLCHQFFIHLGDISPLEETAFHLLPFHQRVWLLKGLCDNVYETQKDVRDAVLAQPIHECRESILGYDSKENAYIHFPHFCGADLRVYRQSPSRPPAFPFPSVWVKKIEADSKKVVGEVDDMMARVTEDGSMYTEESSFGREKMETLSSFKRENGIGSKNEDSFQLWPVKQESDSERDSSEDTKLKDNDCIMARIRGSVLKMHRKKETIESAHGAKRARIDHELAFATESVRTIHAETHSPCLSVGEHSYTGRSPARSPTKPPFIKSEDVISNKTHQSSSCSDSCSVQVEGYCGTSGPHAQASDCSQSLSEKRVTDKVLNKKKCKKKRGRQQLLLVKGEDEQLWPADRVSLHPSAESAVRGVTTVFKRKDKKKHKPGKKLESAREKNGTPVEPIFKLVCTNLDELRTLISKTEDELDELESTKNRLGRWFYQREAVKELHSTLIRLLNELLPWEPKLVKAFQRNRLRLKKEFDDFKKHPDYNNFSREECISTSSSEEDEEKDLGKMCPSVDHYRGSEDDLEHVVPRGLWSGATSMDGDVSAGQRVLSFPSDFQLHVATAESICPLPAGQSSGSNLDSPPDSLSTPEAVPLSQYRDANFLSTRPPILHFTAGLPKGYTPIPTLLAKSVGNKVTLMKRPIDTTALNNVHRRDKRSVVSMTTSAVATTTVPEAQNSQHNSQLSQVEVGLKTVPADLFKPAQSEPKCPAKSFYKVAEGLGQLVSCSGDTGEKATQQVVILPPNLLIQNPEQNMSHFKDVPNPVSSTATPLCLTTNVPGFTIPEKSIPAQHEASPKNALKTHSTVIKSASVCQALKKTPPLSPSIMTPSSRPSTPLEKQPEPKQELKTVCIRDSQSILVTTRGGNTGIVKVQTSASSLNSFSSGPVITLSPQMNAFLLSKMCPTLTTASPTSTSSTAATTSASQIQNEDSTELKFPSPLSAPTVQTTSVFQSPYTSTRPAAAKIDGHGQAQGKTTVHLLTSSSPQSDVNVKSVPERSPPAHFTPLTLSSVPSSSSHTITAALSRTNAFPSTRVMLLNQSTAPSAATTVVPKQVKASATPLPTSLSSLKVGVKPEHPAGGVNTDDTSRFKNYTLPTGLQIQLSGKTTTIGQSIGALSHSPSKSNPVSLAGLSPAAPARPVTSSLVPSCPAPLSFSATLTKNSKPLGAPSVASSSTSVAASKNNTGMSVTCPVQVTHTALSSSTHNQFIQQPPIQTSLASPVLSKPQDPISSGAISNTQIPSAASAVQQRIVINTATPLAAGTQILLNKTRFVVPPQGLGPGSHVLIISNPGPHQVPSVRAALPPHGPVRVTPQAPVLPRPPAIQLSTSVGASPPAVGSFVATRVAPGANLLNTDPHVQLPVPQGGKVAPFSVCTLTASPRLSNTPALGSPVMTCPLATIRFAAGSPPPVISSPTTPCAAAASASSLSTATLPPGHSSIPIPVIPNLSYLLSHPHQQEVTEQHAAGKSKAAPLQPFAFVGLGNTKPAPTLVQPVLAGEGAKLVPTVAPIVRTGTRIQALPIGTVLQRAPPVTSLSPPITQLRTNDSTTPPVVWTNLQSPGTPTSASGINQNVAPKLLISPDGAVLSTVQSQVNPENVTTEH
ncbi:putative bromodomain-containing protein 10 [Neosynchiropus ocellatus]